MAFGDIGWRERLRPLANIWVGAGALAALALVLLVVLNPAFAVREISDAVLRHANLILTSDSARFQFFPQPALRLSEPQLATANGSNHVLVTAEAAVVPITLRTLLSRRLQPASIHLEQPVINILINADGQPGWTGVKDALDEKLAENSLAGKAFKVTTADGIIKFLDERNGQRFQLMQAALEFAFDRTGSADVNGTLAIAEQFARIDVHVDSLTRLVADGSPTDVLVAGPTLEASYSGLFGLRGGASLAGTFAAGSDNASKLAAWMGLQQLSHLDLRELRMSGPLRLQAAELQSKDLNLRLGSVTMRGDVSLATAGPRPIVAGNLSAPRLSFAGPQATGTSAFGWPDKPVNFGWIKEVDLNLTLDAERLTLRRLVAGPASLKLRTSGSMLTADLLRTPAYGGTVEATLSVDAAQTPPSVALRLAGEALDLGQAGRDAVDARWLQAKGDLTVDVSSSGQTVEELVSKLGGESNLNLAEASIVGFDLPASIAAAAGGERDGWVASAGSTQVAFAKGRFTLRDGIASSEDLQAKVAGVTLAAKGDVDLLRKAVDLQMKPNGQADAIAIRATGAWQKPKLAAAPVAAETDLKKAAKKQGDLLTSPEGN